MLLIFIFVLGACIGSFLNVCICRIPAGESIVFPRSRCKCGAQIPWHLNIPLLSWLFLGGKAQCCGRGIPARYFIVEFLTATLFVVVFARSNSLPNFIIGSGFCSLLLAIAFIDMDTMEIYDAMSVGGMFVGFVISLLFPQWHDEQSGISSLVKSLSGACLGSGLIFWVAVMGEMVFKKEAIGGGDVKLLGTIGAFIGWKGCLFSLFGGCLISTLIFLPSLLIWKLIKTKTFTIPRIIPFAPVLVIGSITHVLCGRNLLEMLF
ncbi:MAG: prepilin peptidase [Puniceicoccales bacterium]|jgi:leader peptidase (prepilin peptidase)/N-methyltransferase|nr:prepilin peptidase [Puniceicoccales bacterium]